MIEFILNKLGTNVKRTKKDAVNEFKIFQKTLDKLNGLCFT